MKITEKEAAIKHVLTKEHPVTKNVTTEQAHELMLKALIGRDAR